MINQSIRDNINKYSPMRFKWGVMDCCQFVAKVLGINHEYEYSSEEEANKIISGFGGMVGFISHILNRRPGAYGIGDPVVIEINDKSFCGINLNNGVIVKSKSGVIEIDKEYITAGWSCG